MKTNSLLILSTILAVLAACSAPSLASAGEAVVPCKASYIPEPKIVGKTGVELHEFHFDGNLFKG